MTEKTLIAGVREALMDGGSRAKPGGGPPPRISLLHLPDVEAGYWSWL
jgi:hypothetical protein